MFASADGHPSGGAAPAPSPSHSAKGEGDGKSPAPSASPSASASPSSSSTPRGKALSQALTAPTPKPSPSSPLVQPSGQPSAPAQDFPGVTDKAVIKQFESLDCCNGDRHADGANDPNRKFVAACDQDEENGQVTKYILGPVRVLGENVDEANAMPPNAQQGQASWSVSLKFDGTGAKQFGAVTTDASRAYQQNSSSPQAQVAIVLDGQVVSAPAIREGPITGGTASIDGPPESFDQQYATDLANVLKYGALPLEFKQSSIEEVSSTLGSDQLTGGLIVARSASAWWCCTACSTTGASAWWRCPAWSWRPPSPTWRW